MRLRKLIATLFLGITASNASTQQEATQLMNNMVFAVQSMRSASHNNTPYTGPTIESILQQYATTHSREDTNRVMTELTNMEPSFRYEATTGEILLGVSEEGSSNSPTRTEEHYLNVFTGETRTRVFVTENSPAPASQELAEEPSEDLSPESAPA